MSKEYKATFTHNPQDYFEGLEPEELVETMTISDLFDLIQVLTMVDEGYKAIIEPGMENVEYEL